MAKKEVTLADFIGHKLKDIGSEKPSEFTLYFDNGYEIKLFGKNKLIKKEKSAIIDEEEGEKE